MSETPRTDAIIVQNEDASYYADKAVALCRQLERELNKANEHIKELNHCPDCTNVHSCYGFNLK